MRLFNILAITAAAAATAALIPQKASADRVCRQECSGPVCQERCVETEGRGMIALIAGGEGWHNNHHADSRSARHGHKWWEIDLTWMVIRLLMLLGLARNVAVPSPTLAAKFNASGQRLAP